MKDSYYERNREEIKERLAQYRKDNPDKLKEQRKRFFATHPNYHKQWRKNNPDKRKQSAKRTYLKRHYQMTVEDKDRMRAEQNYRCASCGKSEQELGYELRVDHDHKCCPRKISCGKCIRGLLCDECNLTIGNAKDNPTLLRNAADYLEKFNRQNPIDNPASCDTGSSYGQN